MLLKLTTAYTTAILNTISYLNDKYCTATTPTLLQVIQQAAPAVVATVGVVAAVMALAQPPSGGSSGSSSGNPSPGSQGGGAPPVATSAQAAAALGLAPLGTVPVAIFPPYETPRTLPAISVIFAENPVGAIAAARRLELSEKVSHFASNAGNK